MKEYMLLIRNRIDHQVGAYMSLPHSRASANSPLSYLEALADANSLDTPEIVGPVHLEISDPGR